MSNVNPRPNIRLSDIVHPTSMLIKPPWWQSPRLITWLMWSIAIGSISLAYWLSAR